jgi:putative hemolysin
MLDGADEADIAAAGDDMGMILQRGRYQARRAAGPGDIAAAQRLRHRAFRGGEGLDADAFDAACTHVLVEDDVGRLAACFRLLVLPGGGEVRRSYAAQFYDLSALAGLPGPMAELGRFCIDPAFARDPDVLRLAWGAMTRLVDAQGVRMLFGCASFRGTDPAAYHDAFALLAARHLAPARWRPGARGAGRVPLAGHLGRPPDRRAALQSMPPLLRSYLGMGGRVSDHAVVDPDLGTLHVFCGLDTAAVPPARARALRAVAGGLPAE